MGFIKNHRYLLLITSLFCFIGNSSAAIKNRQVRRLQNVSALEKKIVKQKSVLKEIKNEIYSIETSLVSGTKRYKYILKKKNTTEIKLYHMGLDLKKQGATLKEENLQFYKLLKIALLESFDADKSIEKLMSNKILVKKLSEKIKKNNALKEQNKSALLTLNKLQDDFNNFVSMERELVDVLNNMEHRKKQIVTSYLSESKQKDLFSKDLIKLKVNFKKVTKKRRVVGKKLLKMSFYPPIYQFEKINYAKKGITYSFKDASSLYATQSGTVIYKGMLSTYGNVIMIDHGKEIKTVILGDFMSSLKKGSVVKQGDVIGQTQAFQKKLGNIYFEVRMKNSVQKTIQLIDSKFAYNHNSKKTAL